MNEQEIIEKAIEELHARNFGVTEQLLEIHSLVHENGSPKVLRVISNPAEQKITVYFAVEKESFYIAVPVWLSPQVEVGGAYTEPYHAVYFSASSKELSTTELMAMTTLSPTEQRKMSDPRQRSNRIFFEPNKGPGKFEDKLDGLLDLLEKDPDGVRTMVEKATGYIQIASIFHNGNTMLGGHHFNKTQIKRLAELGVEVDTDLYAEGKFYKD